MSALNWKMYLISSFPYPVHCRKQTQNTVWSWNWLMKLSQTWAPMWYLLPRLRYFYEFNVFNYLYILESPQKKGGNCWDCSLKVITDLINKKIRVNDDTMILNPQSKQVFLTLIIKIECTYISNWPHSSVGRY